MIPADPADAPASVLCLANDHEALKTGVTCVTAEVHEDLVETVQYLDTIYHNS